MRTVLARGKTYWLLVYGIRPLFITFTTAQWLRVIVSCASFGGNSHVVHLACSSSLTPQILLIIPPSYRSPLLLLRTLRQLFTLMRITPGQMTVIYSGNLMERNELLPVRRPQSFTGMLRLPRADTNSPLLTGPTDALDFIDLRPQRGCWYSGGSPVSVSVTGGEL